MCPGLLLSVVKDSGHQLRKLTGWWPKELRSMSEVVKNANLGVKQHGIRAHVLCQVAESRDRNEEGFSMPEENTKQKKMG